MKLLKRSYLWLLIFAFACNKPEVLKKVKWKNSQITWEVLDGGATTSYRWLIKFQESPGTGNDLIFDSYADPYITDVQINKNQLLLLCFNYQVKLTDTIAIDLNKVEAFVDDPVVYRRTLLKETNNAYAEPGFIKAQREYNIAHDLL